MQKFIQSTGKFIGAGFLLLAVTACELPSDEAELIKVDNAKASALVYTASIRGAYFLEDGSGAKFCAEPPPDIALDTLQKLAAKLNVQVTGAGAGGGEFSSELSGKVVELAGRTQLIVLARELLYRACELSLNHGDIAPEQTLAMYQEVVNLIKNLGQADLARAQADVLKRAEAAKKAGIVIDKILDSQ